jgi:hypothetical protein
MDVNVHVLRVLRPTGDLGGNLRSADSQDEPQIGKRKEG